MRERRNRETEEEYRKIMSKCRSKSMRRQSEMKWNEPCVWYVTPHGSVCVAMESPDQQAKRLIKLAERMRMYRANESPDQGKFVSPKWQPGSATYCQRNSRAAHHPHQAEQLLQETRPTHPVMMKCPDKLQVEHKKTNNS
ncbi:hypothetical protein EVAR_71949_1 [Eumeta japonica]|uniref:STPR domain-containing protein n=1 Tax=Eumeta variegata TaxID=151549 RepID=A0A4C1TUG7_EUMVA|nr:hypothetical protein EVAR_71949_1 [Eumeta japonica]